MAYSSITKPGDYFNTKLYTGNGSTQSITGVGFQPDWTWIKGRGSATSHQVYDVIRGATKRLVTQNSNAEDTATNGLTAFDSDGFSLGTDSSSNGSSATYVGWNWKANGAGSANTDGSISSTVSANITAGFSIVSYTGTGANATVGHGLGAVPKIIVVKKLNGSPNWAVYHTSIGATKYLELNATSASQTATAVFNDTEPTSSVFSIGTDNKTNGSSGNYIAYCFAEKKGYSKFGKYTGNGNADGTFVYTGFKPAFLMIKPNAVENWHIFDNTRSPINAVQKDLRPNLSNAESDGSSAAMDFLSNGFKFRNSDADYNTSGREYIYMAFG